MSQPFYNHSSIVPILRHKKLPLYATKEFDFFRCVPFEPSLYGKTVSELHSGNLRYNNLSGRYSKLFPDEKLSYWADSINTAKREIIKHGSGKDMLIFWSYDDNSSSFPTIRTTEPLIIIDGLELHFHTILDKIERRYDLTNDEQYIVDRIRDEKPDCLAYKSVANSNSVNYLFFEKGFKKLSLREVKLHFGTKRGNNHKSIICSVTCDYSPVLKGYGEYFEPIIKTGYDDNYANSEEYKERRKGLDLSNERYKKEMENEYT